jgi:hypothetical protein
MSEPVINANPWENEIDSFDAANILGISVNNLRQLVFKKKLQPVGRKHRRTTFRREDVMNLKAERMKELKSDGEVIVVSQQDHPQDW